MGFDLARIALQDSFGAGALPIAYADTLAAFLSRVERLVGTEPQFNRAARVLGKACKSDSVAQRNSVRRSAL